jgi:hypothetical protein
MSFLYERSTVITDLNDLGKREMDDRQSRRCRSWERLRKPSMKINTKKDIIMGIEKLSNIYIYCED